MAWHGKLCGEPVPFSPQGDAHRARTGFMAVPGEDPLYHGEYTITVANRDIPDLQRPQMLHDLLHLLRYDFHIVVRLPAVPQLALPCSVSTLT